MSENYELRQQQINRNRLSVKKLGVGLAGLDGVNQKIPVHSSTRAMLINAIKNGGVVKINVQSNALMGTHIETKGLKSWGEKLDAAAKDLKSNDPSYFVLFREPNDCLIATFVPDNAKPKQKMIYASSKESLKDAVLELDDQITLEEFNVAEVADLSFEHYNKKMNAPKPYSQQEIMRQQEEEQETAGNYGILARLMQINNGTSTENRDVIKGDANAKPMALPGMSGGIDMNNLRMSLKPIGKTKISRDDLEKKPVTGEVALPKKKPFVPKGSFSPVNKEMADLLKPTDKATTSSTKLPKVDQDDDEKTVVIKEVNNKEDELEFEIDIVEDEDEDMKNNYDLKSNIATAVPTEDGFDDETVKDGEVVPVKLPPAQQVAVPTKAVKKQKKPGFFSRFFGGLFGRKFRPTILTPEEIEAQNDTDGIFSYTDLVQMKQNGALGELDAHRLESYLSSKEFSSVTNISKTDFYKTKPKEQNKIRRDIGLL